MPVASMKQLLESGVHFGHQTRRWNPKMKPYIFTERGGIHIIDLQQTSLLLDRAYDFVRNVASRGGTILFVGTKKQCQDIIREEATRVGMPYVSHRWLGGLLTNFATIESRIRRLHELRKLKEEGQLQLLPTKERMALERELEKLEINLGGVSNMTRLPDAVFIVDPKREAIATKEVKKLGIPLVALVDTNCDPDEVDYLIPGNDDAIRSCSLIVKTLARAVEEGRQKVQIAEFLAAEEARERADEASAHAAKEGAAQMAPAQSSRATRPNPGDSRGTKSSRASGGDRDGHGDDRRGGGRAQRPAVGSERRRAASAVSADTAARASAAESAPGVASQDESGAGKSLPVGEESAPAEAGES